MKSWPQRRQVAVPDQLFALPEDARGAEAGDFTVHQFPRQSQAAPEFTEVGGGIETERLVGRCRFAFQQVEGKG